MSTYDPELATQLLADYAKERGLTELTVYDLIASHRRLVDELNSTTRKEWREAMDNARNMVYNSTMDNTWVSLDKLRAMSVKELVELLST